MISSESYVKQGKHLPPPLRDFHDAKDVFKTMHEVMAIEQNPYARDVSWINGQCYVIDIFLWFMARRGWTLQRSRADVEFMDLSADIKAVKDRHTEQFMRHMKQRAEKASAASSGQASREGDGK